MIPEAEALADPHGAPEPPPPPPGRPAPEAEAMTAPHVLPPPLSPRRSGRTGEAVGAADRLRGSVAERIADLLAGAAHPIGDVYVGWHAARDVATCPARYRGQGPEGWAFPGWTAPLAGGAGGPGGPPPPPPHAPRQPPAAVVAGHRSSGPRSETGWPTPGTPATRPR